MKKFLLTLTLVIFGALVSNAFVDSYVIDRKQLPEEAQQMLTEYFPKAKISVIKVDRHLLKKTDYDVKLVNGTKIEFNSKGKWTNVDCGKKEVPEGLLKKAIRNNVNRKFPDTKIVRVKKVTWGFEIGLSNGKSLKFDHLGSYKGEITND